MKKSNLSPDNLIHTKAEVYWGNREGGPTTFKCTPPNPFPSGGGYLFSWLYEDSEPDTRVDASDDVRGHDTGVRPGIVYGSELYGADGTLWKWNDFSSASGVTYSLLRSVARGSDVIEFHWTDTAAQNGVVGQSSLIQNIRLAGVSPFNATPNIYTYTYSSGRLTVAQGSINSGLTGVPSTAKITLDYRGASENGGPQNSLKVAKGYDQPTPNASWVLRWEQWYWANSNGKVAHVLRPADVVRMRADGLDPATANETTFAGYASQAVVYDGGGKVSKVTHGVDCCSGADVSAVRYTYGGSTATSGLDKWFSRRTDNARPDLGGGTDGAGQVTSYYLNGLNQVVARVVEHYASGDTSPKKTNYWLNEYDTRGRLVKEYAADAVSGLSFNSNGAITATKNANAGQIRIYDYYTDANETNGLSAVYTNPSGSGSTRQLRIDGNIDFNWGTGSPDAAIASDSFTAEWTGQIVPQYSETYTLYVTATGTGASATVALAGGGSTKALTAGQRYNLKVTCAAGTGSSSMKLEWQSASQARQVVPSSRLYPGLAPRNFLKRRSIQKGEIGAAIPLEEYEYASAAANGRFPARVLRYPNDANTNDSEETLYTYPEGFYAGTGEPFQPVARQTDVKLSATRFLTTRERFNSTGRVQFTKDPAGSVTFYQYDTVGSALGGVIYQVRDINTGSPPSGVTLPSPVPSAFATASGLNLVTSYGYDAEVRATPRGPDGRETRTLVLERTDFAFGGKTYGFATETRSYPLYKNGSSYEVTGPVSVTYAVKDGPTLSRQTAKVTLASASAGPASGDTINKVLSWSDPVYSTGGQLVATRVYHRYESNGAVDTSGGTAAYLETSYEYGPEGRIKKTTDPAGKGHPHHEPSGRRGWRRGGAFLLRDADISPRHEPRGREPRPGRPRRGELDRHPRPRGGRGPRLSERLRLIA